MTKRIEIRVAVGDSTYDISTFSPGELSQKFIKKGKTVDDFTRIMNSLVEKYYSKPTRDPWEFWSYKPLKDFLTDGVSYKLTKLIIDEGKTVDGVVKIIKSIKEAYPYKKYEFIISYDSRLLFDFLIEISTRETLKTNYYKIANFHLYSLHCMYYYCKNRYHEEDSEDEDEDGESFVKSRMVMFLITCDDEYDHECDDDDEYEG